MDFEQAKAYLSTQDSNGASLYTHLSDIVKRVLEERPSNVMNIFENLSLTVKGSKIPSFDSEIQEILSDENEKEEISQKVEQILRLLGKPEIESKNDDTKNDEENEANNDDTNEEPIDITKIPNLFSDKDLYDWSGINIDEKELYLLQNSFVNLIRKYPTIIESRFWGKIHAIFNDYYIVEAKLSEYPELTDEQKLERIESPGFGANEYVYFVTTIVSDGVWKQLPNVTPNEIKGSKNIHKLLTGNLDAKITGINYFEGNESNLLRCIIQRISCSTIIGLNNYYKKPDEPNEDNPFLIELNEEFKGNDIENPLLNDNWVHIRGHLRLEGRIKKYIKPDSDDNDDNNDENKDEIEPTPEEIEQEIEILTTIKDDKCDMYAIDPDDESGKSNVWYYRDINKNIGHNIIVLNNKIWNGAKTIYVNGTNKFVNIYVGNGLKYRGEYYKPTFPEPLQQEFNEYKDEEVPNPENQEETITQKVSVYTVESDPLPPPPEADPENNENPTENNDS